MAFGLTTPSGFPSTCGVPRTCGVPGAHMVSGAYRDQLTWWGHDPLRHRDGLMRLGRHSMFEQLSNRYCCDHDPVGPAKLRPSREVRRTQHTSRKPARIAAE